MKNKSVLIIGIILICIPTQVFAWLSHQTYEACNPINFFISFLMRMIVFAIVIGYITGALGYLRYSKKDGKQKAKNLLLWLIIVILQIAILLFGASGVYKVGIEEYWIHTGKINKVNEVRGFFSSFMRVTALTTFLTYLINGIIYFVKSKEETYVKIKKILKWQLLVAIVLITTLTIAKIL